MAKRITIATLLPLACLLLAFIIPKPAQNPDEDHQTHHIVFIGDSLMADDFAGEGFTYPSHVAAELANSGIQTTIHNYAISGVESNEGMTQIEQALSAPHNVSVVVIGLGGNDILHNQPIANVESNLAAMIERVMDHGITRILLTGLAPRITVPKYGKVGMATVSRMPLHMKKRFLSDAIKKNGFLKHTPSMVELEAIYKRLKARFSIELIEDICEPIGWLSPDYRCDDFIHPNAVGHRKIAVHVSSKLKQMLTEHSLVESNMKL